MTNTQSPAPGVAAEVERLMSLADEFADDRGEATRPFESQKYRNALESALHGALQGGVSADVTDDQVRAALNTFNNDNNETGTRAMRRALEEFLASRTPAPGMAGGVDYKAIAETLAPLAHHAKDCLSFTAMPDGMGYWHCSCGLSSLVLDGELLAAPHPAPAQQAAGAEPSAEQITEWAERHDIRGSADVLRTIVDDARSLHLAGRAGS